MDERERREQPMERGHRAQWASGEPPAKPSGLKRARLTTHGDFLNRLLRGLKRARLSTHGNFLNMRMTTRAAHAPRNLEDEEADDHHLGMWGSQSGRRSRMALTSSRASVPRWV